MRELSIDWAALHSAFQMNMPEVRCFLSVEDGRVLKLPPGDPALATVRTDPQRFLAIDAIPSRIQYQWLAEFILSVTDETSRGRMEAAINGKGAFRRFKDILLTMPEERRRWFEYRDQMMRQRIVEWVQEQGVTPLNPAPWTTGEPYGTMGEDGMVEHPTNHAPHAPAQPSSLGANHAQQPFVPAMPRAAHAIPDNVGNVAPMHQQMGIHPRGSPAKNNPHEIEALRDFLIDWSDKRSAEQAPGPLELEELADEIAKHFHVKSVHP